MGTVAVMGAGSWGTVFAMLCADAGNDVVLWARDPEVARHIRRERRNPRYVTEVVLPDAVKATADPAVALAGAQMVAVAIPSHALRATLGDWRSTFPADALAVSLVKGIEVDTRQRASEVIANALNLSDERVVVVSGPNLAGECAQRLPSATVAACPNEDAAQLVQRMSHTDSFRVYTNPDRVGVELGGAVKNAIALAAGMADGMGYGDNSKAMLITRGLAEMTRLGVAYGGHPLTFAGLAGMGDLVATCMSRRSRNRHVGEELGKGRNLEEIIAGTRQVAEGVRSSQALVAMAAERGVEMPIVEHVVKVVHEGRSPREMVASLMARDPKPELHGLDAAPSHPRVVA